MARNVRSVAKAAAIQQDAAAQTATRWIFAAAGVAVAIAMAGSLVIISG